MSEGLLSVFSLQVQEDLYIELRRPTVGRRQRNLANSLRRREATGPPRSVVLSDPAQLELLDLAAGSENDLGNVEYKFKLVNLSEKRKQELKTQMRFRLNEGKGQAFYVLGVRDDGRRTGLEEDQRVESLSNLEQLGRELGAKVRLLRTRPGEEGLYLEAMVTTQEWEKAKSNL